MDFTQKVTRTKLSDFASELQRISRRIGIKVSARGWCYLLEQARMINKDEFDKAEGVINRCRREGFLPVDFVAEEAARKFEGISVPTDGTVKSVLKWMLRDVLTGHRYFTPDWWDGEDYYVQMVVEKIDLVTLLETVTVEYHIPIANSKGITENGYTWIDNLITGSGKNLASPRHPNFKLPYVQNYLNTIGPRKCEANAIVTTPDEARELCREAIENIVGDEAIDRFAAKRAEVKERYAQLLKQSKLAAPIQKVIDSKDE